MKMNWLNLKKKRCIAFKTLHGLTKLKRIRDALTLRRTDSREPTLEMHLNEAKRDTWIRNTTATKKGGAQLKTRRRILQNYQRTMQVNT